MAYQGKWISPPHDLGDVCPVFQKKWADDREIVKAELLLTAMGTYEAKLNGQRISEYVLAPGWTAYEKRLQCQIYDITELLQAENELQVTVGRGWFRSPMPGWDGALKKAERTRFPCGLFGEIRLTYANGEESIFPTDETWTSSESAFRFSEIYDGETYDATFLPKDWQPVVTFDWSTDILIPQEGEEIREKERIAAKEIIITPKGETVVDFGQEVTGYVEFSVNAKAGDKVKILCGEMLDADGNFYHANYRDAKSETNYICRDGEQTWHPVHTFFGFRYIKLERFPGTPTREQFTAIAVYSDMKRTGRIRTSNPKLNQLFSNIIWGQIGNFLDVPTDCPQRDERLGWTGDAQVFVKAASYNFDVEKFFVKWFNDLRTDQFENGAVPDVIPDWLGNGHISAAWGDAAVICPWQIYLTYGNKEILEKQFESMKKWIGYITNTTKDDYLWTGMDHYGDWCGLDADVGSSKGASREDFIASAYYAYSTSLVVKAGKAINEDVTYYEELYERIVEKFRATYTSYETQTEYILALHFHLAVDSVATAKGLAERLKAAGYQLQTGFVGTPYLLHALSKYGYRDIAYGLLLREEYPSWLYSVNKGATTIWEHWDGIMEDGSFWSTEMNSFNHYAYGAVADWIYEEAAGINPVEAAPGFAKVRIEPKPDKRIDWLEATIDTRQGLVRSCWKFEGDKIKYEIDTPVATTIVINGKVHEVKAGSYIYWSDSKESKV